MRFYGASRQDSTSDHIVTIRIILEQVHKLQNPLYLVFIDNEESVGHPEMQGSSYKIVNLIEEQYEVFTCRVLHKGTLSNPFRVVADMRLGCTLSLQLFLIAIDVIMMGSIDRVLNR